MEGRTKMKITLHGKILNSIETQIFDLKSIDNVNKDTREYMIQEKLDDWKQKNGYSKVWYSLI